MITCIKREFNKTDENGRKWWRCILTASEEPGSLTLSGADVDDLNDEIGISAGSVLITPSAQYVFLTDGQAGAPEMIVTITSVSENIFDVNYAQSLEDEPEEISLDNGETKTVTITGPTFFMFTVSDDLIVYEGDVTVDTESMPGYTLYVCSGSASFVCGQGHE